MTKIIFYSRISLLFIFISLVGCGTYLGSTATVIPERTTQTSAIIISMTNTVNLMTELPELETLTLQPTHSPTSTSIPTPVELVYSNVTMSPEDAEKALVDLLRSNGDCAGKCIAGIKPEEMTVQEAVNIMSKWGMPKISENSLGTTFINLDLPPLYNQAKVYLSLGTWEKKFVTIDKISIRIEGISASLLGEDVWQENYDDWAGFRLDNLLYSYGTPTYVGFFFQKNVESGLPLDGRTILYGMDIQFEPLNLVIYLGALAYYDQGNVFICPTKDPRNLWIEINPESSLRDRQEFYPITWQVLTNSDLKAFHNIFTIQYDQEECVTTTLEQISNLLPEFR